jgi:AbrB family looped-hinge helix DNA binding protein
MYNGYTLVGQRGQITIPKVIRKKLNIKEKDKLLVTIKLDNMIVKKVVSENKIKKLMAKGYKEMTKIDQETVDDFKYVDSEANDFIGDY